MQKYNDPLPGRHGYLANPPFYGSTLVEAATAFNRESVGNQSQQAPSLNGDFFSLKDVRLFKDLLRYGRNTKDGFRVASLLIL